MTEQQTLQEISWERAEQIDSETSPWFKPETNIVYIVTFKDAKLVEKNIQDYNDKSKMVRKAVLQLYLDSVNGVPVDQLWEVLSFKLREKFRDYVERKTITKHEFKYFSKGEGKDKDYNLSVVGDRKQAQQTGLQVS